MAKILSQFRICSTCKKEKCVSEFGIFSRRGRVECRSSCAVCLREIDKTRRTKEQIREKNKKYYEANKEKENQRTLKWYKNHPERARELTKGFRSRHPDKDKFWQKRYYENNKPKFRAYFHVRRSRIKGNGGVIATDEWKALCEKYGNRCINPNCSDPSKPVTLDHVVPIFLGGLNVIENSQPLCRSCNSRKGIKIIDYRELHD